MARQLLSAIDFKVNGWNAQGEPWKFTVIAFPLVSSSVTLVRIIFFPLAPRLGIRKNRAREIRSKLSFINL